jgi:SAM-dependent methyltransferase
MARRGFDTTGVDLSSERIQYAQSEAEKAGLANCRFVQADLRELHLPTRFDWAYSFFNTFSLFTENDDLLHILDGISSCLMEGGRLIINLGSLWADIAEGKFCNDSYERKVDRGNLIRKEKGTTRISRTNNVYRHDRVVQYVRDGVEYPPQDITRLQRIFSVSEWDLLCRLTSFRIERVFSAMDVSHEVTDHNDCDGDAKDHELVLVLAK